MRGVERRLLRRPPPVLTLGAAALVVVIPSTLFFFLQRPASAGPVTFKAGADAYTTSAEPQSNHGGERILRISAAPTTRAFLRFPVSGISRPVTKATLRLWSPSQSAIGYQVRRVASNRWEERTITAANSPPFGDVVAASGPLPARTWASADVTELVSRSGDVSLALTTLSRDPIALDSRESDHPAELVVETEGAGDAAARLSGSHVDPSATDSLRSVIENVTSATGYRYATRDDNDSSMDGLKVIQDRNGDYLGVYHSLDSAGVFHARVATSSDLVHWAYKADLDAHASQPTVAPLADGGYLVVEEADDKGLAPSPSSWLRFLHYPALEALLRGLADRRLDAPHTFVGPHSGAEGTPNIYSAALTRDLGTSTIEVGFHYFKDAVVDQPARGTLKNFSEWSTKRDEQLLTALSAAGATGSAGDRDRMVFRGSGYTVAEVDTNGGGRWRPYLYDERARRAIPLEVTTHGGSSVFGNPTFTTVRAPSGAPAVVVTLFIPRTGAAQGEMGELVYYSEYGGSSNRAGPAPSPKAPIPHGATIGDPVIAAAGDIACARTVTSSTACHQGNTAELIRQLAPTAVLALGDEQYETGTLDGFEKSYQPSWGQFRDITRPVPGNHEYQTADASGYYSYFQTAAGDPSKGYYSFDIGTWHVVALNSNCHVVGGCESGSPEEQWLRADLASHRNVCTLAFWHHPRFSSGEHGNEAPYDAFWRALYDAGADVVLNGHDHDYERLAPQDPDANLDASRGIREFVVGTGGKSHYGFTKFAANSEVRNADTFGVLELTLHARSYDWRFVPEAGASFTDSGNGVCH